MATLVVNKPGAGLDSGRQGSRGAAVVKVRDLACALLHSPPPFGSSSKPDYGAAAQALIVGMRGLWAALGSRSGLPSSLRDLYLRPGLMLPGLLMSDISICTRGICEKDLIGLWQ